MSKQTISEITRRAIWEVHGKKCFYCNKPIYFSELEIDHIIPKSLAKNKIKYNKILEECNLPTNFNIENFQNLVSCHRMCNGKKSNHVFSIARISFFLELNEKKIKEIELFISKFKKLLNKELILSNIKIAYEKGEITIGEVIECLQKTFSITKPVVVCFGLNINDLTNQGYLKGREKPLPYYKLCDLFEDKLLSDIKKLKDYNYFISELSSRDGECLSIRIAFYDLRKDDLSHIYNSIESYWQILEVESYYDLYEKPAEELYFSGMSI